MSAHERCCCVCVPKREDENHILFHFFFIIHQRSRCLMCTCIRASQPATQLGDITTGAR